MVGNWRDRTALRLQLALVALGGMGAGVALVLAMGAATQRAAFEGGLGGLRVAGVTLAREIEKHTRATASLAERLAGATSAVERGERLRAWLSAHPAMFSALFLIDGGGEGGQEILRPKAGELFVPAGTVLATETMRRRVPLAMLVERGGQETPLVLIATPLPNPAGGPPAGAVVAGLEAEVLGPPVLAILAGGRETLAFLACGDALLVADARTPAWRSAVGKEAGMPREAIARFAAGAAAQSPAREVVTSEGQTFLATAVGFDVAGTRWVVGMARPWRMSFGEADRFILLAGLAALVALAGMIGLTIGLRRIEARHVADLNEVDRWRATAEAARRDAWRRALLALPGAPVLELEGGRIVAANARAARYLGVGASTDLVGRSALELVAGEDREKVARLLRQAGPAEGAEEAVTASLEVAGGAKRIADLRRLQVEEGKDARVFLTWHDATGRERGEALVRALAGVVHVPLVFVERSGKLAWCNRAYEEMSRRLGVKLDAAAVLERFEPADRRLLRVMFTGALRGKRSEKVVPLTLGEGEKLAVVLRAAPVAVAGEVFGVVFAGLEVRGAPPAAVALPADQRAEALATLAAGLSHRLNNDLQAIQGLLAQETSQTERLNEVAAHLRGSARELQRFVSVCSRSGETLRPARLSVLLDRWRALKAPSMPPGTRLVLNSEVTEDRVIVDARQIESFLDYALAATTRVLEGEGGAVAIGVERGETPGTVRLSVRDTGRDLRDDRRSARGGLPEAMAREAVLAVAQLIAARHGGTAGWRRPAGVGSYVWLDLPLRPGAEPEPPRPSLSRRGGVVLVADDEEAVRASLAGALRGEGFEVEEASNGAEVLAKVRAAPQRYALIVLDLIMPVLDGREVLRHLAREAPGLPVLLCTGYEPGVGDELGGADVLIKPFSLTTLVERVEGLLGRVSRG